MERTYFSVAEARAEVGRQVEALSDFPSVPKGTTGKVVRATQHARNKWAALVEWDLPGQTSAILAMVIDTSFNFMKSSKPVTDVFCKSEYEALLRTRRT